MKTLLSIIAMTLITAQGFAQSTQPNLPTSLKLTMKAMGQDMKTVAAQITNKNLNTSSATLTDQFVILVKHAETYTPDSISSLPADQQPAAKDQFVKALEHVADLGNQISAALKANDNAQASRLLNDLLQAKKDGHNQFDP